MWLGAALYCAVAEMLVHALTGFVVVLYDFHIELTKDLPTVDHNIFKSDKETALTTGKTAKYSRRE